jgi:signal peptidase I
VDSIIDPLSALKCDMASEVLRSAGHLRLRVHGWSMLPTVMPGDTVVLESTTNDDVAEGEIVLFRRERRFFIHRVVRKFEHKPELLTRGDAMQQADPPVGRHELLGKVLYIERNGQCVAPSAHLTWRERAVAAIVRRSEMAARVVVVVHNLRKTSPAQT